MTRVENVFFNETKKGDDYMFDFLRDVYRFTVRLDSIAEYHRVRCVAMKPWFRRRVKFDAKIIDGVPTVIIEGSMNAFEDIMSDAHVVIN